MIKSQSR